jgi:hypothetical protein
MLALETQDPNVHPISVKIIKRERYRLAWLDEDLVMKIIPYDSSEMHAINMCNIINIDQTPKSFYMPWIDLQVLYLYTQTCINNDTKKKIMADITIKMIQESVDKPQSMWGDVWWLANSMSAQAMWSNIQQGKNNLQSMQQ